MFGQMGMPPWMQGMQDMGQQMTPGSGQPPYSNAPMNMSPPQMMPPMGGGMRGAAPMMQPPPQQPPINPAQMGMLSQMLAQQTRQPNPATPPAMGGTGAPTNPYTGGLDPMQMGMLTRMLGGYGGPR